MTQVQWKQQKHPCSMQKPKQSLHPLKALCDLNFKQSHGIAISRVLSWVAIYLGTMLPRCSSEGFLYMKSKPSLLAAGWVYKATYVAICAGGLLPHRFTFSFTCKLTCKGSLLSVALSLKLPWPSVRWNHTSLQLGLSSWGVSTPSNHLLYHRSAIIP